MKFNFSKYLKLVGRGVFQDLKNRVPYYVSDWTDAYNYRVIPSAIYIFFTNLLPALAFAQDMFDRTNDSYGVNEVLLSSALAGITFGVVAGQPLCIVGVTGPISIFNYTVYNYVKDRADCNYFSFMCWIGLWSCLMHMIVAILNGSALTRYVTRYSCDAFGLFINCIYVEKGIQILIRQFSDEDHFASGYFSVVIALLMAVFGVGCSVFGSETHYFYPIVRKVFADYGTPLCVVFFTGFIHFDENTMQSIDLKHIAISKSFSPTAHSRNGQWFVTFWKDISVGNIFLAIPFAILLTLLFFFDHNVSSLMAQDSKFKLKKPSSFHWDFFLLGITTGVTGIIGVPFPNGLIPQAPLHTLSLCTYKRVETSKKDDDVSEAYQMQLEGVVEQRFTNTVQGLLTLGMMSRPLLIVLHTIPQAVFAGLFFIMGVTGLHGNEIVNKIRYVCTDRKFVEADAEFRKLSSIKWLYLFILFELLAFGFEFGICQTDGAVAFPAVLCVFAGFAMVFYKIFPTEDLKILDEKTGSKDLLETLTISLGKDKSFDEF